MKMGLSLSGQGRSLNFESFLLSLLDFCFPLYCLFCGRPAKDILCPSCRGRLVFLGAACPICARPYQGENDTHLCQDCAQGPRPFQRVFAPFRYEGPLAKAISQLKYEGKLWLARPLGRLWPKTMPIPPFDLVIPVPLHRRRLLARGFNQSLLLAQKIFGRSLVKPWLERIRDTRPQVGLSLKARAQNVRRAFALAQGVSVSGKRVLLFDDVMTTGATVEECAKVLKASGTKEIYVAVLARAG